MFDDFVNLSRKEMKILFDYAITSRKFGFTCVFISQSYTSVPKIISRNCNYLFIFRLNDHSSIKRIISNHSLTGWISPQQIEQCYRHCIKQPLGFLLIGLKTTDDTKRLRCDFTGFLLNTKKALSTSYQSLYNLLTSTISLGPTRKADILRKAAWRTSQGGHPPPSLYQYCNKYCFYLIS